MSRPQRRKRRRPHQRVMFDDCPVYTHQHAASVVGEFFEHLTAKIYKGWRVQLEDSSGFNPDIETHDGHEIESKGSARARWLIAVNQVEYFEQRKGSLFVLYRYPYSRESLISRFETKQQIFNYLAANVREGYAISANYIRQLADNKLVEGLSHGTYMQIRYEALQMLVDGGADIPLRPTPEIHLETAIDHQVLGLPVLPFDMFTIADGIRPDTPPPF